MTIKNYTTQNLCPSCGADWDTLKSMLEEPDESPNPTVAYLVISNCRECREHFVTMAWNDAA